MHPLRGVAFTSQCRVEGTHVSMLEYRRCLETHCTAVTIWSEPGY